MKQIKLTANTTTEVSPVDLSSGDCPTALVDVPTLQLLVRSLPVISSTELESKLKGIIDSSMNSRIMMKKLGQEVDSYRLIEAVKSINLMELADQQPDDVLE